MPGAVDAATIIPSPFNTHESHVVSYSPLLAEQVVSVLHIAYEWIATEFDNVTMFMVH